MNMAKYGSRRSQQPKNVSAMLNQLEENLKVIFLTATKCKIRFIYICQGCPRFLTISDPRYDQPISDTFI